MQTQYKSKRSTVPFFWMIAMLLSVSMAVAQLSERHRDIEDQDIEIAIQNEMFLDQGVASHLIDIDSNEGVVTLSGSVDNILARQRAREIAMATKGVRSVVNTIEVMPLGRAAKDIRNDVEMALAIDPTADSYEVEVSVKGDGVVSLTGTVDSWAEEQLCLDVARGVRGVRQVQDNLTIDLSDDRADAEIRLDVLGRLRSDVRVDDGLIEVAVSDANVILTGSVGSEAERQRAFSNAWVNGARSVDISSLDVQWWLHDEMTRTHERPGMSDADIKDAIQLAYAHDPRVLSFKPSIEVEHGVVTLTGRVSNLAAKKAAAETARNTFGVWRVHDYLLVRPEQQLTDRQLESDILKAIDRNPYTSKLDVAVVALNGSITIRGEVDSQFEKEEMLEVVSNVQGVLDVHDFIDVGRSWAFKTDWNIKEDIEKELWWSPFVDEDEIKVIVEDGIATLTGEVDDWSEWAAAMDNAYEGGARQVRNQLKVADWPGPYTLN